MTDIKKVYQVSQLLSLDGKQSLLGTGADEDINVVSDFDLQEFIDYDEKDVGVKLYKKILKFFQNIFKEARRNTTQYPVIPDLKCGVLYGGEPVRWNYETIMKGFQYGDNNEKIRFIDCLQEKSTIKIDYLAFIDDKYVEFSSNYYFDFGLASNTHPITTEKIISSLLMDAKSKLYDEGKPLKALKRLYAGLKLTDIDKSKIKFIVDWLNSKTGEINKIAGDLELIPEVLKFRNVPRKIIKTNIKTLAKDAPRKYRTYIKSLLYYLDDYDKLSEQVENVKYNLMKDVNDATTKFFEKNEKKLDKLFIYSSIQSNK